MDLNIFDPHPPHDSAVDGTLNLRAAYLRAAYLAMIELADAQIGGCLTPSTDRASATSAWCARGAVYEGLVRVPLIWRWLRRVRAGLRSDALVELTDIVPTGPPLMEDPQSQAPKVDEMSLHRCTLSA